MRLMAHKLGLILGSVVALTQLVSCTTSIVHKPEIDTVKTVAVISVFSNSSLYNTSGESLTGTVSELSNTFGLSGNNADKKEGNKLKKLLSFGGTRLIDHALIEFEHKLAQVKGWQVVPSKSLVNQQAYANWKSSEEKKIANESGILNSLSGPQYTTADGMVSYPISRSEEAKIKGLGKLARELKVDAVAIAQFEIAYSPKNSFGGMGSAEASITSSVMIVNSDGKVAVAAGDGGSGWRFTSDDSIPMVAGSIAYNDAAEKMFKQAISRVADYYYKEINENI